MLNEFVFLFCTYAVGKLSIDLANCEKGKTNPLGVVIAFGALLWLGLSCGVYGVAILGSIAR